MNDTEQIFAILEKLNTKLLEDIEVTEAFEHEYLLNISTKIAKWQALYSKKYREFKKAEEEKDSKFKELYLYYQYEYDLKLDKKELNTFITADTEFRKVRSKCDDLETILNFIEKAIKTLENQNWSLKNRLDYMKVMGFVDG
jgi:flagellar biosynthesis chaperone FliJ